MLVGVSAGAPTGGALPAAAQGANGINGTTILFNIGSNRSLRTLVPDLLNSLSPNVAISFLTDAINTCKAFGSTIGGFKGVSIGVSLMEVKLFGDNIF